MGTGHPGTGHYLPGTRNTAHGTRNTELFTTESQRNRGTQRYQLAENPGTRAPGTWVQSPGARTSALSTHNPGTYFPSLLPRPFSLYQKHPSPAFLTFFPEEQLVKMHPAFLVETLYNILFIPVNINMEILIQLDNAAEYAALFFKGGF